MPQRRPDVIECLITRPDGRRQVGRGATLSGFRISSQRAPSALLVRRLFVHSTRVQAMKRSSGEIRGFTGERTSSHFYHALCHFEGHDFTCQVVLDANLFDVGSASTDDGVVVADLEICSN